MGFSWEWKRAEVKEECTGAYFERGDGAGAAGPAGGTAGDGLGFRERALDALV